MKFGYAWTFVNKPRGETPAPPPEKRAPALPRRRLARGIRIAPPHAQPACFRLLEASKIRWDILKAAFDPNERNRSRPAGGGSRSEERFSERRLNAPYRGGMVNVRMLNSEPACVSLRDFREISRVSGRFPRFKKPFKYIRSLPINQFSPPPGASVP